MVSPLPPLHFHAHLSFTDCCKGVNCCSRGAVGQITTYRDNERTGYNQEQLTELFSKAYPVGGGLEALAIAQRFGSSTETSAIESGTKSQFTGRQLRVLQEHLTEVSPYVEDLENLFDRLKVAGQQSLRKAGQGDGNTLIKALIDHCKPSEVEGLIEAFEGETAKQTSDVLRALTDDRASFLDLDRENFWKLMGVVKKVACKSTELLTPSIYEAIRFEREENHILYDQESDQLLTLSKYKYWWRKRNLTNLQAQNRLTYEKYCNVIHVSEDSAQQALFNRIVDIWSDSNLSQRYEEGRGLYSTDILNRWKGQKELAPYWDGIYSFYTQYIHSSTSISDGTSRTTKEIETTHIPLRFKGVIELLKRGDGKRLDQLSRSEIETIKDCVLSRSSWYKQELIALTGREDLLNFSCAYLNIPYRTFKPNTILSEQNYLDILAQIATLPEGKEFTGTFSPTERLDNLEKGYLTLLFPPIVDLYKKICFDNSSKIKSTSVSHMPMEEFLELIESKIWTKGETLPSLNEDEAESLQITCRGREDVFQKVRRSKSLVSMNREEIDLLIDVLRANSQKYQEDLLSDCGSHGLELFHTSCVYMGVSLPETKSLKFIRREDREAIQAGIDDLKEYYEGIRKLNEAILSEDIGYEDLKKRFELSRGFTRQMREFFRQEKVDLLNLSSEQVDILYENVPSDDRQFYKLSDKRSMAIRYWMGCFLRSIKYTSRKWNEEISDRCDGNQTQVHFAKLLSGYHSTTVLSTETLFSQVSAQLTLAGEYYRALSSLHRNLQIYRQGKERSSGPPSVPIGGAHGIREPVKVTNVLELEVQKVIEVFYNKRQVPLDFALGKFPEVLRDPVFSEEHIHSLFRSVVVISTTLQEKINSELFWRELYTNLHIDSHLTAQEKNECINITAALNDLTYRHASGNRYFMTTEDFNCISKEIPNVIFKFSEIKEVFRILNTGDSGEEGKFQPILDAIHEEQRTIISKAKTIDTLPVEVLSELVALTPLLYSDIDEDAVLDFTPQSFGMVVGADDRDQQGT